MSIVRPGHFVIEQFLFAVSESKTVWNNSKVVAQNKTFGFFTVSSFFWIVIQNREILVQVHQHKLSLNDTKISGLIISIRNVYRFAYISIVILLRKFTANYCHNMCVAYQWVICMYRLVWWWITFFARSSDHVVNVYASMVLKRTVYGNKILLCSVNCISSNAFTISIVFLSLEHACQNVLR